MLQSDSISNLERSKSSSGPTLESVSQLAKTKEPLLHYIRRNPRVFLLGLSTLAVTNFLDAIWPLWLKQAIDKIQQRAAPSQVAEVAIIFFLLLASLSITRFSWRIFFAKFQLISSGDLAENLFFKTMRMPSQIFSRLPVGDHLNLITNDIQAFRQAIGPGLLIFADGLIIISIVLPIMINMEAAWTYKTLCLLPLVPFMIWVIMNQIQKRHASLQESLGTLTSWVQESVNGIRVVKSFALENDREQRFAELDEDLVRKSNHLAKVDSLFGPVMTIGVTSGNVILLFVAQDSLLSGAVSIGSFIAFQRYIQKMVWPMTALGMGLSMIQKGRSSFNRIQEQLRLPMESTGGSVPFPKEIRSIEFVQVSFSPNQSSSSDDQTEIQISNSHQTPSRYLLKNINFRIEKGDRLAITGPVGSGKSILLQLLSRQLLPTSGQILINQIPIQDFDLRSLRKGLAFAPQEVFLFSDSVANNIGFSDEAIFDAETQSARLQKAMLLSGLEGDLQSFPDKERSMLGEKGVNISGGQKQRVSLARALFKQSPLLIVDDSLSAVDTETESLIQRALENERADLQIIVAHRLSSLKHCNLFLVLNQGEVDCFGEKEWVEKHSSIFKQMTLIQEGSH